jgi:hypothetical protein
MGRANAVSLGRKLSAATVLWSLLTIPKQRSLGWLAISNSQPAFIYCSNAVRQALRFLALRAPPRRRRVKANTAKIVHEM